MKAPSKTLLKTFFILTFKKKRFLETFKTALKLFKTVKKRCFKSDIKGCFP